MLCFRQPPSKEPFARHVVYSPRGYVVPRRDGRLLAGSTTERAGFDASVTDEGVRRIRSNAAEIAPAVASLALEESWAGLRPRASDGLPLIGESAEFERLFYATHVRLCRRRASGKRGRLFAQAFALGAFGFERA